MLFRLRSVPEDLFFLGQSNAIQRGIVTLGVQDTILARGTNHPMRLGGVRKAVVPSELAYGRGGVSRYEALRLGLRRAVPRDEMLRYEIELLRCSFAEVSRSRGAAEGGLGERAGDGGDNNENGGKPARALACCPEEKYPCKISPSSI